MGAYLNSAIMFCLPVCPLSVGQTGFLLFVYTMFLYFLSTAD
ncbi:hypothetical protein HMPREF9148_00428 [Prevotella sp. F0091]|nr:hypothetical protein HMPREF9148_00428 [Prevotella sp. F0091]